MKYRTTRKNEITLDVGRLRDSRMGRQGLSILELKKLQPQIQDIVRRIERERKSGKHRYRELPHDSTMIKAVADFAVRRRGTAENLVVLGIGGSALGAQALFEALCHPQHNLLARRKRSGPRLFVMDNVDPDYFGAMLDTIRGQLDRTVFNVISKSGETAETASQFLVIRELLTSVLGAKRARKQIVVTTDMQGGSLRKIALEAGYACLPVPEGVGGRFSVLSAVGLFPAAMCGIDVVSLLRGAARMDRRVARSSLQSNPAALFAAVNHVYYRRGRNMVVMMPYSNRLSGLADWFAQLWAESLGKDRSPEGRRQKPVGPTPIRALGATDQHSQIQLYREGPPDKLMIFLEVGQFDRSIRIPHSRPDEQSMSYLGGATMDRLLNIEKKATESALVASRRPCATIRFPRIDADAVGQFVYMLEAAVPIMAGLLNVDPYDQPGVELGKKITRELMSQDD